MKPDQPPQKSEIEPHELTSRMSKEQIGQFVDLLLKTGKPGKPDESMVTRSQQPNRAKTRPLARGAMRSSTNRLPLAR
jgi:hypothetical protein